MTDSQLSAPTPLLPRVEFDTLKGLKERLFARVLKRATVGRLTIELPGGRMLRQVGEPGPEARLAFTGRRALSRLFGGGHNGFAEAFMDGDIEIDDTTALFHWFLINEEGLKRGTSGTPLARILDRIKHLLKPNSRKGARKNIRAHYDLGNDFYSAWLDPSMSYSAALFDHHGEALIDAQHRKYDRVLDQLNLKPGDRLLEIGCGWGGLLERAQGRSNIDARGITISKAQHDFAKARMAQLGAADSVVFEDYRDTRGQYDAIASIEMFEAVGEANWPTYFNTVYKRLKPGGRALIQVITIEHARYLSYRRGADFIQRYIFPGGMLPSPERFEAEAQQAGLSVADVFTFGKDYAETLRRWRVDFENNWTHLRTMGFDDRFRRMWLYYLTYCEAGFDHGSIDVAHYLLKKDT